MGKSMMREDNFEVVLFGEMMVLLIANEYGPLPSVEVFRKKTAGAETNVAIALSRLEHNVAWCSLLGNDSMGVYLRSVIEAEGVNCEQVKLVDGARTGFMLKGRVLNGDPPIEYYRSGSAASQMSVDDIDFDWLSRARHLHVTGIFPALSTKTFELTVKAIEFMKMAGKTVSFDPNLRPSLWKSESEMKVKINYLASLAHWVLPGFDEGKFLTGASYCQDVADFYHELGVDDVVIKLGPKGAYYSSTTAGKGEVVGKPVVNIVDTVGAGDGFAAGFISGRLDGLSFYDAVRRGTIIGASAVQVESDTDGYPKKEELLKMERE